MADKKILIIDDEGNIADMIAAFCQSYGFETKVLNDGATALEVAKEFKPDLITLDLVMPGTSGFEVVEMLKKDPETSKIPIIVISSYGWSEEAARAFNMTKSVVIKPVTRKVLGEKIETVLGSGK